MFLDFWIGGALLAGTAILSHILTGRFFGVSSFWERVIWWRETKQLQQAQQDAACDTTLAAETQAFLAELSEEERTAILKEMDAQKDVVDSQVESATERKEQPIYYAVFLLGLIAGGWLSQNLYYNGALPAAMPDIGFLALGGSVEIQCVLLVVGGILVGFGTRMLGGCTSGHGLIGCSNLKTASIVSTALFFGIAILVNLAITAWLLA